MDPKTLEAWLGIAWQVGSLVAGVVLRAMKDGDLKTLDALREVLPDHSVLAARDEALRQQQRVLAEKELKP